MQLAITMSKHKHLKSNNNKVNPYFSKILQEKHPLSNDFSIVNITKEKFINCDICDIKMIYLWDIKM